MSAVHVPADAIFSFLRSHGFSPRETRGAEIVYERRHKVDSRFKVLVYTSVRRGSSSARAVGKDAIRVCAIYEDATSSRGLCKLPRVHRTGTLAGVFDRMLERMREAYQVCCDRRPKPEPLPRTNLGTIDNCALANGHPITTCQMCLGACPDVARLAEHFDDVQQKHHPGSMPEGYERQIGDHFPEDDLDGDDT